MKQPQGAVQLKAGDVFAAPLAYSRVAGCGASEWRAQYESIGWQEGLNPHPMFDTTYFMRRYGAAGGDRSPFDIYDEVARDEIPVTTPFFQVEWYLTMNQDLMQAGVNPIEHYVRTGVCEGRQPNPWYNFSVTDGPATDVWDRVASFDGFIHELDTARLVDAGWLTEVFGLDRESAHLLFWRDRYRHADRWLLNPERILGSINPVNFASLADFSETLERLLACPKRAA